MLKNNNSNNNLGGPLRRDWSRQTDCTVGFSRSTQQRLAVRSTNILWGVHLSDEAIGVAVGLIRLVLNQCEPGTSPCAVQMQANLKERRGDNLENKIDT